MCGGEEMNTLFLRGGDCVSLMAELKESSVSAILCDPPYGLKFFTSNKKGFDNLGEGKSQSEWHMRWLSESFRVLKKGGVIRAFSSNRTMHRLLFAMDAAGFSDVSVDQWLYVSGRPKSVDVAKSITCYELTGSASKHNYYELDNVSNIDNTI